MPIISRLTLWDSVGKSAGRMPTGYGLYGLGTGGGRVWADPEWGTLTIPRTVAKPAATSIDVGRRIGVPPQLSMPGVERNSRAHCPGHRSIAMPATGG